MNIANVLYENKIDSDEICKEYTFVSIPFDINAEYGVDLTDSMKEYIIKDNQYLVLSERIENTISLDIGRTHLYINSYNNNIDNILLSLLSKNCM